MGTTTERTLAKSLAAEQDEAALADRAAVSSIQTALAHEHLPALADAGLVDWDREAGTVESTDHPALDDPRFRRLVRLDGDGTDEALRALSVDRRAAALTVLRSEGTRLSGSGLATPILRLEGTVDPGVGTVERCSLELAHVHLPMLAEHGFIEYDRETGAASYLGTPAMERVFEVLYGPEDSFVDRYEGFLSGLGRSLPEPRRDRSYRAVWPRFWDASTDG